VPALSEEELSALVSRDCQLSSLINASTAVSAAT
jgi:hypothetical protein